MCLYVHVKNISPSWRLIKCDSSSMFWSTDDRWLTIVVVVLHVGSNIHFDCLTFTAICRYSNTVKRFFAFFKRRLDLQAPLALQMLSITFYFTFSVWVHLEKTSQRRHLFQHQQGGFTSIWPPAVEIVQVHWKIWTGFYGIIHKVHVEKRVNLDEKIFKWFV